MSRYIALFLVIGLLSCGEDDARDFHVILQPGPPASVPELGASNTADPIICDSIACCEAALGIESSVCLSLSLDTNNHCKIEAVFDGTPCGSPAWCGPQPICEKGICTASENSINCADETAAPCHRMECDAGTNSCVPVTMEDGAPCEDGSLCTSGDSCLAGSCVAGSSPNCDDQNPCTNDECIADEGCVNAPLSGQSCDDNSLCTTIDACDNGECLGTKELDCSTDNPCVVGTCDPETGCQKEPVSDTPCEDGNPCTESDTCQQGLCVAGNNTCECNKDSDCSSNDALELNLCSGSFVCENAACVGPFDPVVCPASDTPCFVNMCEPSTGKCALEAMAIGSLCDDNNLCTTQESCTADGCIGAPIPCEDDDACTNNECAPESGCVFKPNTGNECDDKNPCTASDTCQQGVCEGGSEVQCDDQNECTADSCNWATGCTYTPVGGPCEGVAACTVGSCLNGECGQLETKQCTDDDLCVTASCDKTTNECVETPIQCNDGDVCTDDACDPNTGCTTSPVVCDDSNACTTDACVEGNCVYSKLDCNDNDKCTIDFCHTGKCVHKDIECTDDNPCAITSCMDGDCQSTLSDDLCDDDNPCTADSCTEAGCAHTNQANECDDNNDCTIDDVCVEDQCVGTNLCNPCDSLPEGATCDDDDSATIGDLCLAGTCAGFTKYLAKPNGADKNAWLGDVVRNNDKYWVVGGDQKNNRGWIGEVQTNGVKVTSGTYKNNDEYVAIDHRAAITRKGLIAYYNGTQWKHGTTFHNVFAGISDATGPTALWGMPTLNGDRWTLTGTNTSGKNDFHWVLHCDRTDNNFNCNWDDPYDTELSGKYRPQAIMGWPANPSSNSENPPAHVIVGGQYKEPNYPENVSFNDVYWLNESDFPVWDLLFFDNSIDFNSRDIRDIHGTNAKNVWWVGSQGLFGTLSQWNGMTNKVFVTPTADYASLYLNGVWATDKVVLAIGTHRYAGQDPKLTLLTHAVDTDPTQSSNWIEIPLMTVSGAILDPNDPSQTDQRGALRGIVVHEGEIIITGWAYSGKTKQALVLRRSP